MTHTCCNIRAREDSLDYVFLTRLKKRATECINQINIIQRNVIMFSFRKLIEKKKKEEEGKIYWSIVLACSMFKMFIDDTFYCERGRKASL